MPTDNEILLNHPASSLALQDGSRLPSEIEVSMHANAGRGEDDPIFRQRMTRDGWTLVQEGRWGELAMSSRMWYEADPPETWVRGHPSSSVPVRLRMRTLGIGERQGPWYVTHYDLLDDAGAECRDLGRADWADWDSNGDLLFAQDGKLHRIVGGRGSSFDPGSRVRTLIDLSPLTFEAREPVPEAKSWSGPRPRGVRLS
jgi:hypothetical protein